MNTEIENLCSDLFNDAGSLGQFGDYIGGVWGTILAAASVGLLYLTLRKTGEISYKTRLIQMISEMLRSHDEIVKSINSNNSTYNSGYFGKLLSEFSEIFKEIASTAKNEGFSLDIRQKIDLTYTFLLFGARDAILQELDQYDRSIVIALAQALTKRRANAGSSSRFCLGHQNYIGNYMRNLFGIYNAINNSELTEKEKYELSKLVRVKLSNYEQALLMFNCLSRIGDRWNQEGYTARYAPFKNIPKQFFVWMPDFDPKEFYPTVIFEWEERKGSRSVSRTYKIWSVVISFTMKR